MMTDHILVSSGFPNADNSGLTEHGKLQIKNLVKRIREIASIQEPLIQIAQDNCSQESAEMIIKSFNKPKKEIILELNSQEGLRLSELDKLYQQTAAQIRGYQDVITIAHPKPVRDLAFFTLIRDGFKGSEYLVANEGGWYNEHSEQWEAPHGGAFVLRYLSSPDQVAILRPNPEIMPIELPKPEQISAPVEEPQKIPDAPREPKKVNLASALREIGDRGLKPVFYVVHDTNLSTHPQTPEPFVIAMGPGAANDFWSSLSQGRAYLDGKSFSEFKRGKIRGTIQNGCTNFTRTNNTGKNKLFKYENASSANNVFTGDWQQSEEYQQAPGTTTNHGKFRMSNKLESLDCILV